MPSGDRSSRWRVAVVFALLAALYSGARHWANPTSPSDFDQLWYASRAFLSGTDPYSVVGPGKLFEWSWPMYYSMPAILISVPLAWMPVAVARVVVATLTAGALGWAIGSKVRWLWPVLLSASFLIAVARTQWSPLMLASMWVPWFGFAVVAKPNLGLVTLAAHERRRDLMTVSALCALMIALSFLVRPDWLISWWAAIGDAPHVTAPVMRPWGFLLLMAVIRWRETDARVFLLMACVPHTPSLYDLLLLFFLCRSLTEALGLAALLHVLFWGIIAFAHWPTFDTYYAGLGRAEVLVVYLPVLARLLLRPATSIGVSEGDASWRSAVPSSGLDVMLSLLGFIGAFFLIWIPIGLK